MGNITNLHNIIINKMNLHKLFFLHNKLIVFKKEAYIYLFEYHAFLQDCTVFRFYRSKYINAVNCGQILNIKKMHIRKLSIYNNFLISSKKVRFYFLKKHDI